MSSPIGSPNEDLGLAGSEPEARAVDKLQDPPKLPFLSASMPNGEKVPPELRQILQYCYILDQKKRQAATKAEETTIKIRIPPRPQKKPKITYYEEDDEGPVEAIRLPISNKLRIDINKNRSKFRSPLKILTPKRVFTPDWESAEISKSKNECFSHDDDSDTEPDGYYKNLDDTELHKRLEIFENRIIYGSYKRVLHPAEAINLLQKDMNLVMTKEESEKAERYNQLDEVQIIPSFWEPRPYDKPENMLSSEQSIELTTKIIQSTIRPERPKTPYKSEKKSKIKRSVSVSITASKKMRPRKIETDPNVLTLPYGTFETDDEDALSEWEDFI
ncbi:hypothetical protein TVAG_349670 [Trichomonas vaginalis G3]|uniref:Uncharacterized protein n=1 Tax=Trichomonas vaginalis (strain ATCC PRA-98 / G3) TaxID=412133 RepID=A2EMP4_TRIV3|nr:hypothetical protein TVAGG3_0810450 [Trichomonas vaginalis G3]EAY06114.1 hypothetical protein TVAG_349670 [Trichomonas vaginalis G3]KAI5497166.1 hypothetical protein TVAGG3_0810450 [Trichomonas vaginalis G3]|eukprot:XP_001318337.1 hypothetical protein [Trichomonas vaginalis G3]